MTQTHHMSLRSPYFEDMASGRKYVELRLNDEKRKKIQPGDHIIFTHADDKDKHLTVTVVKRTPAPSFAELLTMIPSGSAGSIPDNQLLDTLRTIYSAEQERQHGVVGIHIQLTT